MSLKLLSKIELHHNNRLNKMKILVSRQSSWNETLFKGSKSASKMVKIEKFEKYIKMFMQKSVHKNEKIFLFVCVQFVALSELIILHPSLLVRGICKFD